MTESHLPEDPASGSRSRALTFPVDQIGVWTSTLCVIHCLLTPVVLSLSAVSAHFLPSEEKTHRTLAVVITALGAIALVKGYRRHRSWRVLALMAAGLAFIFRGAFWGDHLPSHWAEVLVTLIGSGFMIAAHRTNHTFCRDCSCSRLD
jgi:peptidoglycan/LPS O-acetylase OafA/YrhL